MELQIVLCKSVLEYLLAGAHAALEQAPLIGRKQKNTACLDFAALLQYIQRTIRANATISVA
jgi:hypothetical protein